MLSETLLLNGVYNFFTVVLLIVFSLFSYPPQTHTYSEVPNKRVTFFPASPGQASWGKCNTLIRNFRVPLNFSDNPKTCREKGYENTGVVLKS